MIVWCLQSRDFLLKFDVIDVRAIWRIGTNWALRNSTIPADRREMESRLAITTPVTVNETVFTTISLASMNFNRRKLIGLGF